MACSNKLFALFSIFFVSVSLASRCACLVDTKGLDMVGMQSMVEPPKSSNSKDAEGHNIRVINDGR